MSAKRKAKAELFEDTVEPWQVRVAIHPANYAIKELAGSIDYAGKHTLYFKRRRMLAGKGRPNLERYQRLASHFNKVGAQPQVAVQCAADALGLDAELSRQSKRASLFQPLEGVTPPPTFSQL